MKIRKIYYPERATDDFLEETKHKVRMLSGKSIGKGCIIDFMVKKYGKDAVREIMKGVDRV